MEFECGRKIGVKGSDELITIMEKLGEGGQGTVYRAEYRGNQYALKWYLPGHVKKAAAFLKNLNQNIADGSPTASFLWPILIAEEADGSFGYLMKLRPPEYKSFTDILNAKVKIVKHSTRVIAALTIVESFIALHRQGKSYQDLNDGNFFIDPSNGDVLICDNDNVAPYGVNLGIAGKCRYMAPEVVMGEKPGMQSDYFSLAVMLFLLLFLSHPFEGEKVIKSVCLTDEHEKKHYGSNPVFIFDPTNKTNKPVRGVHNNAIMLWPLYPSFIRDAFTVSFTKGIRSKEARISDSEWLKLFIRLRDEIITCGCGCENFSCANEITGENSVRCLGCGAEMIRPLRLDVQKYSVALYPGNNLYECHTTKDSADFRKVTGEVIRNKNNRNLWGIRNLSSSSWYVEMPDGTKKTIAPNSAFPVYRKVKIDFGGVNQAQVV